MPRITDPMDGLISLQRALGRGEIRMQPCELHPDLQVLLDRPNGEIRITYAVIDHGRVRATVVFAPAEPVEGVPCFGMGYAVAEKFRGSGIASRTVPKAIEEMRHRLKRNGIARFYLEAVVSRSNQPSNHLARRIISDTPVEGTDEHSGEPILQYLRLIE